MARVPRILLLCAASLLPLSCGSSGGAPEVLLAPQNAAAAAGQGLAAVDLLTEMTDLVSVFLDAFEGSSCQTVPCGSGNVRLTLNDLAPEGQLSSGDSATFLFQACTFTLGEDTVTLNGRFTLRAETVTGAAPGPFSIGVSVTFQSLTVTGPDGLLSVDGGLLLEAGSTDGVEFMTAVSGSRFSAFVQEGGASKSVTLANFRLAQQYDEETGGYAGTLDAEITSSEIGGRITYATPVPFSGTGPNDPDDGSFVVTGASGSTLNVLVLDEVNVRILVDTDGDGEPEVTIDTTWDELRS